MKKGLTISRLNHTRIYNFLPGLSRDPDSSATWSDGTEASLYDGLWLNNEPDITAGNCVAGQLDNNWSFQNCERRLPFVCRQDGAIKSKSQRSIETTSREHLRTKVTQDLHLIYSKNGGNLGLILK